MPMSLVVGLHNKNLWTTSYRPTECRYSIEVHGWY